jgi:hypothetical protein
MLALFFSGLSLSGTARDVCSHIDKMSTPLDYPQSGHVTKAMMLFLLLLHTLCHAPVHQDPGLASPRTHLAAGSGFRGLIILAVICAVKEGGRMRASCATKALCLPSIA